MFFVCDAIPFKWPYNVTSYGWNTTFSRSSLRRHKSRKSISVDQACVPKQSSNAVCLMKAKVIRADTLLRWLSRSWEIKQVYFWLRAFHCSMPHQLLCWTRQIYANLLICFEPKVPRRWTANKPFDECPLSLWPVPNS